MAKTKKSSNNSTKRNTKKLNKVLAENKSNVKTNTVKKNLNKKKESSKKNIPSKNNKLNKNNTKSKSIVITLEEENNIKSKNKVKNKIKNEINESNLKLDKLEKELRTLYKNAKDNVVVNKELEEVLSDDKPLDSKKIIKEDTDDILYYNRKSYKRINLITWILFIMFMLLFIAFVIFIIYVCTY